VVVRVIHKSNAFIGIVGVRHSGQPPDVVRNCRPALARSYLGIPKGAVSLSFSPTEFHTVEVPMFRVVCCLISVFQFGLLVRSAAAQSADTTEADVRLDTTITVSVHRSLPKYYIHITEADVPPDTDEPAMEFMNYEVVVRSRADGLPLQTIKEGALGTFDDASAHDTGPVPGIDFRDVNFDGYLDVEIWGGGSDASWAIYLFSPQKRQFLKSEELSRLGYLDLDPGKKEFSSFYQGSCSACWVTATYKVEGDKYILIRRETEEPDYEHPGSMLVIKEELINGVLTQVSKESIKEGGN
jgi:hypothetical protein